MRRPIPSRPLTTLGAIVAALVTLAAVGPARVATVSSFGGRCVGVLDGDSIKVLAAGETHEIRLEGIDAPERGQAFASRAKQTLSDLIFGKDVTVAGKTTDQYGRLVARVRVGDVDTSLEMIRQGLAWHYRRYSSEPALADAESVAKARRVGLWADPAAAPPWSYRHDRRHRRPGPRRHRSTRGVLAGEVHGNTKRGRC